MFPFLLGHERLINVLPMWRKVSLLVEQDFCGMTEDIKYFFSFSENHGE